MNADEVAQLVSNSKISKDISHNLLKDITQDKLPDRIEHLENQILELSKRIQENIWLLGQRLSKVKDEKLYITKCKTFEDFIDSLNISRSSVYDSIKIFKSYKYVQTSGHDKQKLILLAHRVKDEKERNEYLKKMNKENISYRLLKKLLVGEQEKATSQQLTKTFQNNERKITLKYPDDLEKSNITSFLKEFEGLIQKYNFLN